MEPKPPFKQWCSQNLRYSDDSYHNHDDPNDCCGNTELIRGSSVKPGTKSERPDMKSAISELETMPHYVFRIEKRHSKNNHAKNGHEDKEGA
jgi:hypothetical protein